MLILIVYKSMKKYFTKKFSILLLVILLFTVYFNYPIELKAANYSSDAIAIRVLPNPSHYSAQQWYDKQGFKGSPQQLIIDGYESVRDNQTIYINAANLSGACSRNKDQCLKKADCSEYESCSFDKLHTNIYVLAFNLEATLATEEIFRQILENWKVNTNIAKDIEQGECSATKDIHCSQDDQCPIEEYCTNFKSKVVRDTSRLADLEEIEVALERYKEKHGFYPKLSVGTYITNFSVSTWPSWEQTLAEVLGVSLPRDPINELGQCSIYPKGYEEETCWNPSLNKFAFQLPGLPDNSYAYNYGATPTGSSYILKANFESELIARDERRKVNAVNNKIPIIAEADFPSSVEKDEDYVGFISVVDADGDNLKWSVDSQYNWVELGWASYPIIEDVPGDSNKKKVIIKKAGRYLEYTLLVTIDDGKGEFNSQATREVTFSVDGGDRCNFMSFNLGCFF